jgi:hypothetical protein|tara:strand:- start:388 stop:963 length:576 start_codon:yes stop_codon:yes gene_type:complete
MALGQAKHIQWNEIQLEGCGVCGSVAIVPWSSLIYHQCTACGSMLYKERKVRRGLVSIDEGRRTRKETDEEMRQRTHDDNKTYSAVCDGNVVLIKRDEKEHQRLLSLGGPENQQARLLGQVLDSWGFESLEEMTNELARLKRVEDSLQHVMGVMPPTLKDSMKSHQEGMPLMNLADYWFSGEHELFRSRGE